MSVLPEKLTRDLLSLPEEERKGIFLRLSASLPAEVAHLAESMRRSEELTSGKVAAMDETTFRDRMKQLRGSLRHA